MRGRTFLGGVLILTTLLIGSPTYADVNDYGSEGVEVPEYYFSLSSLELPKEDTQETQEEHKEGEIDNTLLKELKETAKEEPLKDEPLPTFYSSDDKVVEILSEEIKAEKLKQEKEQLAKDTAWLKDYGIEPNDLSNARLKVFQEGSQWLGSWYLWGGTVPPKYENGAWSSPRSGLGFDCSGYTKYVLNKVMGIDISRTTYTQKYNGNLEKIPFSEAKPGDIIFSASVDHTGFFVKDNGRNITIMHSSKPGDKIKVGIFNRNVSVYRIKGIDA